MIGFRVVALIALLAIPSVALAIDIEVPRPPPRIDIPPMPQPPPPLVDFGAPPPNPPIEQPRARECHGHCDHALILEILVLRTVLSPAATDPAVLRRTKRDHS
jgi:hypothetical protein